MGLTCTLPGLKNEIIYHNRKENYEVKSKTFIKRILS